MSQTKTQLVEGLNINTSAPADALAVDNNGRVGVGTTSPSTLLHASTAGSVSTFNEIARLESTAANSGSSLNFYGKQGSHSSTHLSGLVGFTQTNNSNSNGQPAFVVHTGNAGTVNEKLRITYDGKVGIGTSSPDYKLHVSGANAEIGLTDTNVTDATWRLLAQTGNTTKLFRIYDSSNAADRFVINASGNVGIGTTSPTSLGTNVTTVEVQGAATTRSGGIRLSSSDSSQKGAFYIYDGAAVLGTETSHPLGFYVGNTPRATIDTSGRLLVGTSTSTNNIRLNQTFSVVRQGTYGGASFVTYGGTQADSAAHFDIKRSRGSTDGTMTSVANNDLLGSFQFLGADGTNFVRSAQINGEVDGTPGANDMPGRLVFSTTADGADTPTERLRIAQSGAFGLSGANYGTSGQVLTSQGSGSAPQWATPSAGSTWTWDTSQTTLSGNSSVTVSGIPSTATKILVHFYNISNNTNQDWIFRLGNSSGIVTSGYHVSTGYMFTGSTSRTNGFHTYATGTASHKWTGFIDCVNIGGTLWYCRMFFNAESDANVHYAVGKVGVTTLDRINFSTWSGTFDDGGIYVSYMEP